MGSTVQKAFFIALLFLVTVAFIWLIRGFLQPIFWAVALGIMAAPMHAQIERRLGDRPSTAAAISLALIVIIVLVPLALVAAAVTTEAAALFQRISAGDVGVLDVYNALSRRMPQAAAFIEGLGIDPARVENQLSELAVQASRIIAARALAIGQDTVRIAIFFFLMLYLLFFLLRDGHRLLDSLAHALPLGDARERHLFERFTEVSRATIKGTLVVGVAQGTIGGIVFAVLGIGGAVLWGVAMTLLSILPAVGPAVVWVPAAVYLFVNGQILAGLALVAIGVLVIGLVDNLLRPMLVGRDTRMPDYLILLSTLGGLAAFGLAGIVIGPVIAAFFLSVWQMAQEEFGEEPEQPANKLVAVVPPAVQSIDGER